MTFCEMDPDFNENDENFNDFFHFYQKLKTTKEEEKRTQTKQANGKWWIINVDKLKNTNNGFWV